MPTERRSLRRRVHPEQLALIGSWLMAIAVACQPPVEHTRFLGASCTVDAECAVGRCVLAAATGAICTLPCPAGVCPPGQTCAATDDGPLCLAVGLMSCQPCLAAADCNQAGLSGYACLGDERRGRFCAARCDAASRCPDGYRCAGGHCLLERGECACNAIGQALAAETSCVVDNDAGSCPGLRGCGPNGLSACVGQTPRPEVCDGRDDDCDGAVDEGLSGCASSPPRTASDGAAARQPARDGSSRR